jgi:hypothetical protein
MFKLQLKGAHDRGKVKRFLLLLYFIKKIRILISFIKDIHRFYDTGKNQLFTQRSIQHKLQIIFVLFRLPSMRVFFCLLIDQGLSPLFVLQ